MTTETTLTTVCDTATGICRSYAPTPHYAERLAAMHLALAVAAVTIAAILTIAAMYALTRGDT